MNELLLDKNCDHELVLECCAKDVLRKGNFYGSLEMNEEGSHGS